MTAPSKTWILSLSPSLILTCTRTVSPGRNSGRPFLICCCSTFSRAVVMMNTPKVTDFSVAAVCDRRSAPWQLSVTAVRRSCAPLQRRISRAILPSHGIERGAFYLFQQSPVLIAQDAVLKQAWPLAPGLFERLTAAPAANLFVVS